MTLSGEMFCINAYELLLCIHQIHLSWYKSLYTISYNPHPLAISSYSSVLV